MCTADRLCDPPCECAIQGVIASHSTITVVASKLYLASSLAIFDGSFGGEAICHTKPTETFELSLIVHYANHLLLFCSTHISSNCQAPSEQPVSSLFIQSTTSILPKKWISPLAAELCLELILVLILMREPIRF